MTGRKLGLIIGCNYPMLANAELYGCVNDACDWKHTVIEHFGFSPTDVMLLLDQLEGGQGNLVKRYFPSKDVIVRSLRQILCSLQAGDVFFLVMAGYGTQIFTEAGVSGLEGNFVNRNRATDSSRANAADTNLNDCQREIVLSNCFVCGDLKVLTNFELKFMLNQWMPSGVLFQGIFDFAFGDTFCPLVGSVESRIPLSKRVATKNTSSGATAKQSSASFEYPNKLESIQRRESQCISPLKVYKTGVGHHHHDLAKLANRSFLLEEVGEPEVYPPLLQGDDIGDENNKPRDYWSKDKHFDADFLANQQYTNTYMSTTVGGGNTTSDEIVTEDVTEEENELTNGLMEEQEHSPRFQFLSKDLLPEDSKFRRSLTSVRCVVPNPAWVVDGVDNMSKRREEWFPMLFQLLDTQFANTEIMLDVAEDMPRRIVRYRDQAVWKRHRHAYARARVLPNEYKTAVAENSAKNFVCSYEDYIGGGKDICLGAGCFFEENKNTSIDAIAFKRRANRGRQERLRKAANMTQGHLGSSFFTEGMHRGSPPKKLRVSRSIGNGFLQAQQESVLSSESRGKSSSDDGDIMQFPPRGLGAPSFAGTGGQRIGSEGKSVQAHYETVRNTHHDALLKQIGGVSSLSQYDAAVDRVGCTYGSANNYVGMYEYSGFDKIFGTQVTHGTASPKSIVKVMKNEENVGKSPVKMGDLDSPNKERQNAETKSLHERAVMNTHTSRPYRTSELEQLLPESHCRMGVDTRPKKPQTFDHSNVIENNVVWTRKHAGDTTLELYFVNRLVETNFAPRPPLGNPAVTGFCFAAGRDHTTPLDLNIKGRQRGLLSFLLQEALSKLKWSNVSYQSWIREVWKLEGEVRRTYLPQMDQTALLFFNPNALPKDVCAFNSQSSALALKTLQDRARTQERALGTYLNNKDATSSSKDISGKDSPYSPVVRVAYMTGNRPEQNTGKLDSYEDLYSGTDFNGDIKDQRFLRKNPATSQGGLGEHSAFMPDIVAGHHAETNPQQHLADGRINENAQNALDYVQGNYQSSFANFSENFRKNLDKALGETYYSPEKQNESVTRSNYVQAGGTICHKDNHIADVIHGIQRVRSPLRNNMNLLDEKEGMGGSNSSSSNYYDAGNHDRDAHLGNYDRDAHLARNYTGPNSGYSDTGNTSAGMLFGVPNILGSVFYSQKNTIGGVPRQISVKTPHLKFQKQPLSVPFTPMLGKFHFAPNGNPKLV